MKNSLLLLLIGCFVLSFSSCLDSDKDTTEYDLTNCQISSFSLANDSIEGIGDVKFVIDQINGYIYNADSMDYGTVLDRKLVTTLSLASSFSYAQIMPEATGDTIIYNNADSVDYSKPVKIVVHSSDGVTMKTYHVSVNIHQVNPDSMVWQKTSLLQDVAIAEQKAIKRDEQLFFYVKPVSGGGYKLYTAPESAPNSWTEKAITGLPAEGVLLSQLTAYNGLSYVPTIGGELYQSADGLSWSAVSGAPSIKAILGALPAGEVNPSALSAVVAGEGGLQFASMDENKEWILGDAVSPGFPVSGFGVVNYESMYYQRLLVAGGEDPNGTLLGSAWTTLNGRDWAIQTDDLYPPFEARTGAVVAAYDGNIYLIGGLTASNQMIKDIYISKDKGITWAASDSLVRMPDDFAARAFSSVIVDKDNYMLLFGGKVSKGASDLNDLWRGRINRLGFKD